MRLVSSLFNSIIETEEGYVSSMVIENQDCFRAFMKDLASQALGADGDAVLYKDNKPIQMQKGVEILSEFAPFCFSSKVIQNKIASLLAKQAMDEDHWLRSGEIISMIENYIGELAIDLPCEIDCTKLSFEGLIKSAGVAAQCTADDPIGEVLEYMELSRALFGNRLFVTVNMRSWFGDGAIALFARDAAAKKLDLLMLENSDHPRFANEKRLTIDSDLCEF